MQSTIFQAMLVASPQNKLQPRSFQAFKSQATCRPALQRGAVRVRAQQQQQQQNKPDAAKFADSIGLPTEEGLFGFKPFPEVWVGRLAMMGFLTSIIQEVNTKKGTLGQVGFITPSPPLLYTILGVSASAIFTSLAVTFYNASTGKMTARDAQRYRSFLGINKEKENIADSQKAMKSQGDPVSRVIGPDSLKDIDEARQNIPADKLLNFDDREDASSVAQQQKGDQIRQDDLKKQGMPGPNMSLAYRDDEIERQNFANEPTLQYARQVEITNGRWAMLGFLAAIAVEAATGRGILSQLILWAKLSGLLGSQSGF